jgi:competence protein ComGC
MSDIPYTKEINPKTKAIGMIIVLLVVGLIVGLIISTASVTYASTRIQQSGRQNLQRWFNAQQPDMYKLGTSIICMNIFLLLGLLSVYIRVFQTTKSSFMLGLLLFIGVLFVQSILSLPILHAALGFIDYDIGLLGILANMFETLALVILLYLSME